MDGPIDEADRFAAQYAGYVAMAVKQRESLSYDLKRRLDAARRDGLSRDRLESASVTVNKLQLAVEHLAPESVWPSVMSDLLRRRDAGFFARQLNDLIARLREYDAIESAHTLGASEGNPLDLSWATETAHAVRTNIERSALTLNALCVKVFKLEDRSKDIPIEVIRSEEQNPVNAEQDASYLGVELGVTADELLRHPEVRQIQLLEEISRATVALATIEARRSELVEQARALEISWARIGAAAKITSQAALRRWDDTARQKHRSYNSGQVSHSE